MDAPRFPGFANVQRVRLLALPTPNNGVRPVYETLVLDNRSGHMTAYTHYVDAANGTIWLRKDLVEQSHPTAEAFSGTVPLVDGAALRITAVGRYSIRKHRIGRRHRSGDTSANDVVIHLLRDNVIVASQDTGRVQRRCFTTRSITVLAPTLSASATSATGRLGCHQTLTTARSCSIQRMRRRDSRIRQSGKSSRPIH